MGITNEQRGGMMMGEDVKKKQVYDWYKPVSWLQEAIHVLTGCQQGISMINNEKTSLKEAILLKQILWHFEEVVKIKES